MDRFSFSFFVGCGGSGPEGGDQALILLFVKRRKKYILIFTIIGGLMSTGPDRPCRFCGVLKTVVTGETANRKKRRFAGFIFGFCMDVVWRLAKSPRN